jgi:hypothetical protein
MHGRKPSSTPAPLTRESGFHACMRGMAIERSVQAFAASRSLTLPSDWRQRLEYQLGDVERGVFMDDRAAMLVASLSQEGARG